MVTLQFLWNGHPAIGSSFGSHEQLFRFRRFNKLKAIHINMKEHAQFSLTEIHSAIEQLETIIVSIKRQTTDNREAIQETFPTLSRSRVDKLLTEPLDSNEMIEQTKQLIQFLIGKTY